MIYRQLLSTQKFVSLQMMSTLQIISSVQDIIDLQSDINNFSTWCNSWSLKINLKKCAVIDFGPASTDPFPCHYVLEGIIIVNSDVYKDLSILVSNNLNFTTHLYRVIKTAHSCANFILRAFPYSNSSTHCKLF